MFADPPPLAEVMAVSHAFEVSMASGWTEMYGVDDVRDVARYVVLVRCHRSCARRHPQIAASLAAATPSSKACEWPARTQVRFYANDAPLGTLLLSGRCGTWNGQSYSFDGALLDLFVEKPVWDW